MNGSKGGRMEQQSSPAVKPFAFPKQVEYGINIVFNAVFLVIVNNILEWGFLPWLTQDFSKLVWLFNISLTATIIANVIFFFFNADWFASLVKFFLNIIGLVLAVRMLQVFPFDFSGYTFDWAVIMRIGLILGIVGTAVGILVELIKFTAAVWKRV
jgi:hypothetical protein